MILILYSFCRIDFDGTSELMHSVLIIIEQNSRVKIIKILFHFIFTEMESYVIQVGFGTHNKDFVMTGHSANGNQGQKKGPFNPLNNLLHNSNAKNFV